MAPARHDRKRVSLDLDEETLARLEQLVEKMQREAAPGLKITQAMALRSAIVVGLDQALGKEKRGSR